MANDERPALKINLAGEDGNIFVVIGAARALLSTTAALSAGSRKLLCDEKGS